MNHIEVLKLYTLRQSIKTTILKYYTITLDKTDKLRRGVVISHILGDLNLPANNPNKILVTNILLSLGVTKGIYSGKQDYRGLILK